VILLVEDNPGDVELFRAALDHAGHDMPVLVARHGTEAVERFDAGRVDIRAVVIDLNLPGFDGWCVLERLRERGGRRPLVAVLTSSAHDTDRARARSLGVRHYFCKPARFDGYRPIVDRIARLILTEDVSDESESDP
jgi:CheY-like chemotaxis protein